MNRTIASILNRAITRRGATLLLALPLLHCASTFAQGTDASAQNWPQRPIRMVVPYPAGGSADTVARTFGKMLSEKIGQPVIIDNKPGASGNIGTLDVMRAKADGYTLLFNPSIHVINPEIMERPPYQALEDFTPISQVAKGPLVLMVSSSLKVNSLADFVKLAKSKPKEVTFATSVIGSASHLAEELFNKTAKVDILIVSYKGNAPALNDLMGGQVSAMFDPAVTAVPLAHSGRVKALAVTGKTRLTSAPDIPTADEAGLKGFEFYTWYGLWGPKNLPEAIAKKLEAASRQVAQSQTFQKGMSDEGLQSVGSSRTDFAGLIKQESALYRSIAQQANIRAN
ncbi:tripartite tricarboxylate transporter substrate binding protein [Cupriavidus sp. L7L]|uniref:Bug family tripartite tricarboxylate transporter substrate binding protein n=1 Tax=Cupriavidus sp. L7L TaxID=2546443 RepID=UPI001054339F|nr:tripartite tricarboxylate transporter substrate binding protein [Cupriavidus sp. L7L]TDF63188.1 tripartite tricarboxylate transporter substrate binding protein [Cupriavidus sp. L7L]